MTLSTRYTRYSASQAVSRAKSWYSWRSGYCLNYVWNCLDVPNSAGLEDANQAWTAAQQKRYNTPPAGAPVYWRSGNHGHIALSLGGGWVRSTDWRTNYGTSLGSIGNATINDIVREWGATYRGWSADYASHPILGLQPKAPSATIPAPYKYNMTTRLVLNDEALRPGLVSEAARAYNRRVWSWLYWNGTAASRAWCVTYYKAWQAEQENLFGKMSTAATQAMYRTLNAMEPRGGWGGSTGAAYPGPALLHRLGLQAD